MKLTSVDAKTSSLGLRALEQIDRLLSGFQHVGRSHPGGHGQTGIRVVAGIAKISILQLGSISQKNYKQLLRT